MYKVSRGKKKRERRRERERRRKERNITDAAERRIGSGRNFGSKGERGADRRARGSLRESEGPRRRTPELAKTRAIASRSPEICGSRNRHFRVICAARRGVENCANEIPGQISARGGPANARFADSNLRKFTSRADRFRVIANLDRSIGC